MDSYTQYARWRVTNRVGLGNRRLAGMLGDFVYETSSAEDESRRTLERLYEPGKRTLSGKDLKDLERFTSEHNRDERRANGVQESYVSWNRIDELSQQIIHLLAGVAARRDSVFVDNLAALDRMFDTNRALREFRNQIDHRAPSDAGGTLHLYRESRSITVREIWGWTEIASTYWTSLTRISESISMATGIQVPPSGISQLRSLEWPPPGTSIHGLLVLEKSAIPISSQQLREARQAWLGLTRKWNRPREGSAARIKSAGS